MRDIHRNAEPDSQKSWRDWAQHHPRPSFPIYPLLDLAGFLRLFGQGACSGWAERGELIERWEQASERPAPDLRYYTTLSAYKLSVMLEGIFQRSFDDPTRGDAKAIGDMALHIMREAQESIRG